MKELKNSERHKEHLEKELSTYILTCNNDLCKFQSKLGIGCTFKRINLNSFGQCMQMEVQSDRIKG